MQLKIIIKAYLIFLISFVDSLKPTSISDKDFKAKLTNATLDNIRELLTYDNLTSSQLNEIARKLGRANISYCNTTDEKCLFIHKDHVYKLARKIMSKTKSDQFLNSILLNAFNKLDKEHVQLTDIRKLFKQHNKNIDKKHLDILITVWSFNVIRYAVNKPNDPNKYKFYIPDLAGSINSK
ncbi:uncharacterized protein LOC126906558 [Daktulosphaira vitifoliae]|uniref:uncharacterized protein LOC126906558 n=1 Tax=Daktulosphaira vitifoliae TaxID=58002 RepID=UPI0021AA6F4D|nr:uncharacterized protein LOC126906558 [Daktulosphaira vitifoliae]